LDGQKEDEFVTHGHLKVFSLGIYERIRQGDENVLKEVKVLDERVDKLVETVTRVETNTGNTEKYIKELVDIQKDTNKEYKETNRILVEKIDRAYETATQNKAKIKILEEGITAKAKDKAALYTMTGGLGAALLTFLGILAKLLLGH